MADTNDIFNSIFSEELAVKSHLTSGGKLSSLVKPGVGVEVGTNRGDFTFSFMSNFKGKLFCVDPYINGYDSNDPASEGKRHLDFLEATELLMDFIVDTKIEFIIQTSVRAVTKFLTNSIDFVYIDAIRKYDNLTEDLENWYEKVKVGGYISGCGIADDLDQSWNSEVRSAVFDFVHRLQNPPNVHIICQSESDWSYYFKK